MNEQKNIGQTPADQHTLDLINASIDGEISASDSHELDRLLLASDDVRSLKEELEALSRVLDELPEVESPDYLQEAIERQVRLPAQGPDDAKGLGFRGGWLSANWLRGGVVLAAAVVLTVGVYEMRSGPITTDSGTSMVGTVAKRSPVNQQGALIDSIKLASARLQGVVELRNKGDLYTLDLNLNSDVPSELVVNFTERGLQFEGVVHKQDSTDAVSIQDGSIHIASSGRQNYTINFKRTPADGKRYAEQLELMFFADSKLIQQGKLIIPPL